MVSSTFAVGLQLRPWYQHCHPFVKKKDAVFQDKINVSSSFEIRDNICVVSHLCFNSTYTLDCIA